MKLQEKLTIEKSPLKTDDNNTKFLEKDNIVYFYPTLKFKILIRFFQLFLFSLWSILFCDFFIEDFKMSNSFWFYAIYIILSLILSIGFLFVYIDHKSKRYFNKNTGKFLLNDIDFSVKEKKIEKILGIQIIGFQKKQTVPNINGPSIKALFTYFQLIIVMHNLKRYNVATFRKRKNIIEVANKLSSFLEKPIFNEIEKFEGLDEETKRLRKTFRSRFILQDNFEINITKEELLKRLKNEKYCNITILDKNKIIVDVNELDIFNLNLGHLINKWRFQPYLVYIKIEKRNHLMKINMETKFRYEFYLYIAFSILMMILNYNTIATIGITTTILFWISQRADEKTLFQILKKVILREDKTSNIID